MQNIVILAGNLGADPESRTTQGGTNITTIRLATSRPRYKDGKIVPCPVCRGVVTYAWLLNPESSLDKAVLQDVLSKKFPGQRS